MAQYRLPDAQHLLDRKIDRLRTDLTPYRHAERREGSPWQIVTEGCAHSCPFAGCVGCGWTA